MCSVSFDVDQLTDSNRKKEKGPKEIRKHHYPSCHHVDRRAMCSIRFGVGQLMDSNRKRDKNRGEETYWTTVAY